MTAPPRTALIVEGSVSQSWIARLPGLRLGLGPVMGLSLRNASRAVNQIRAGKPVAEISELLRAELVLVSVPEGELAGWVARLGQVEGPWKQAAVVVCSGRTDSAALDELKALGAHTGSLSVMDALENRRYLFEGDNLARHRVKRLVEGPGEARLFEIKPKKRAVFEAGLSFASGMTFPMVAAAVDAMRAAGLHSKFAENVVESAVLGTVRAYMRAGKRGWGGAVARADREELSRQYKALFEVDEELAEMFLKIAVDYLAVSVAKPRKGPKR